MKKLADYDEFQQGIPKNKKMGDLETRRLHVVGVQYVTQEDFLKMQDELKRQLEEQATILRRTLIELQQIKLHLASMSNAAIDEADTEVE